MVVVTQAFVSLAKSLAKSRGYPELSMVVLPHPFETLTRETVDRFADDKFSEILANLLEPGRVRPPSPR